MAEQQSSPTDVAAASRPSSVSPRSTADLARLIGARLIGDAVPVTGISASSTLIQRGDLFAALPGSSGHGARYARSALAAGAVAVLTDSAGLALLDDQGPGMPPSLLCQDVRAVLGQISAEIYGHPSRHMATFGVTGTAGKTTTTFLVRAGLTAAGKASGLIGTVGVFSGDQVLKTPFTTPEAPQLQALLALMLERGTDVAGMEVSSHALRMGRVDGVEFEVGAFTNLSQDHLDFHSDMEDYFAAKALLFDGRARREIVVIDDGWGDRLVRPGTVTVATGGLSATWTAEAIEVLADGATRFVVSGPAGRFTAGCRIPGKYNVANTLLAFAILAELGVDAARSAPALAQAQVRGRMERVDGDQPFLAVVDYSHKPAGVRGALQALRPLTSGKLIIVLGCGGDRDRGKRAVMGDVAAREADVLIVTDDNPRSEDPAAIRAAMLAGARSVPGGQAADIFEQGDRRAAIEEAIRRAGPGDTVLVAGKGHETGQQVGKDMLPFDDVTVVCQALEAQGFSVGATGHYVSGS
ncbi:MAG: UDP-N-acetylmuramoyl-L-alanyl-D-glutamate--2,6-diaminopimelate ligase [Pseudonocardiales bacterium]|nr:UDP-N-acetylmuramoyl-L-alanyl-D-glutamate--2,6-diaminopimelate ligase [Pseudonocardiales bacterium]